MSKVNSLGKMNWRRLVSFLLWLEVGLLLCILVALMFIIWPLSVADRSRKGMHRLASLWGRSLILLNPFLCRIQIQGLQNCRRSQTYVIVSNHQGAADIPALYFLNHDFKWIAKRSLFNVPVLGWGLKLAGYIPLKRGDNTSEMQCYRSSSHWLNEGVSVLFFAEGTRGGTKTVNQFKEGAFRLAVRNRIPVLPVSIAGSQSVHKKGARTFNFGNVIRMSVLRPISPGEDPALLRQRSESAIRSEFVRLSQLDAKPTTHGSAGRKDKEDRDQLDWGLSYLGLDPDVPDPLVSLTHYNLANLQDSLKYYTPGRPPRIRCSGGLLRFQSPIQSFSSVNNEVYCKYVKSRRKNSTLVIVPHWRADSMTYSRLTAILRYLGISSICMTLPFHGQRGIEMSTLNHSSSDLMVSSNVALTLFCMRQAVQELLAVVNWLAAQGCKNIGVLGASLGSSVGFIGAAHDERIAGFFGCPVAGSFADVVWEGFSTRHISERLKNAGVTREQLNDVWGLNSPISYVPTARKHNPALRLKMVVAKYDKTFPLEHVDKLYAAFLDHGFEIGRIDLPCGHLGLALPPMALVWLAALVRFMHRIAAPERRSV